MTINVCGNELSVPNKIVNLYHNDKDFATEFDGLVQSIIWAVKQKYEKKESTDWKTDQYSKGMNEDVLNSLFGSFKNPKK